ncbi:MAG: flagellar basal body rod protein FlgF [Gammaproteobacteria bacterium]|nr:flagellar basal body rod protein FlgF [Gammaproteobacteria bacterium]
MDRALYVAMTGAMQTLRAQTANSHNLANAATAGFRAELASSQAVAVDGPTLPTRVNAVLETAGWDASPGSAVSTGRELDVALRGNNWLAVQAPDGTEAYTRAGDLQITPLGQLVTGSGHAVLGAGGPVTLPPHTQITIGEDGTISIQPQGTGPETLAQVGRLRVVEVQPQQLLRRPDGLMTLAPGGEARPVAGPSLMTGTLESSNVNAADALVTMIQLSRQFEMQVKVMKTAEQNAQASTQLLRVR